MQICCRQKTNRFYKLTLHTNLQKMIIPSEVPPTLMLTQLSKGELVKFSLMVLSVVVNVSMACCVDLVSPVLLVWKHSGVGVDAVGEDGSLGTLFINGYLANVVDE